MKKTVFLISFLFLLIPFISKAAVVINEITWMGTTISSYDEWVELYNNGTEPVDLMGWVLEAVDGAPIINLTGTIQPNSYFLLERADDGSAPNIPADLIYGNNGTSWALNNNGENLNLKSNDGNIIDSVSNCEKGWCGGNNTTKQTMEKTATGWQTSLSPGGTPKAQNSSGAVEESESTTENPTTSTIPTNNQPPIADAGDDVVAFIGDEIAFDGSKSYDPDGFELSYEWNLGEGGVENDVSVTHKYSYPGTYLVTLAVFDGRYYNSDTITVEIFPKKVTISEFLPSPNGKDEEEEWIELYNDSDQIADISGWQLDDEDGGSKPFVFPKNTLIAPQSYLVFSRKTTGIALNNDKEKIRLLLSGGVVFQEINYEKAPEGLSSAKIGDKFFWATPTPGIANVIGLAETSSREQAIQTFSTTTNPPEQNISINYKKDENKIPLQTDNQKQNLIANLGNTAKNADYKLIIIAVAITIIAFAAGIVVVKLKKRI